MLKLKPNRMLYALFAINQSEIKSNKAPIEAVDPNHTKRAHKTLNTTIQRLQLLTNTKRERL